MGVADAPKRVLVFPGGTEIGLEIHSALKYEKRLTLCAAGEPISNHALFVFDAYYPVSNVLRKMWIEELRKVCTENRVDYIFPAHDDAVLALAENADAFSAKVISSPLPTCQISRSKRLTYDHLAGYVRVPKIYGGVADVEYPAIVKPDRGQGSSHITLVNNDEELTRALAVVPTPVICEYFPGEEYTVDCFSDRDHGLLFCGARVRNRMRNGIAVNTACVDLFEARQIAEAISVRLMFHGAWFFQIKRTSNNSLGLLEVAPRIAGSMSAHRVRGVNFPMLSIYEAERRPIQISPLICKLEVDRALSNRYSHNITFDRVFVDLDDTLLIGERVNSDLVRFLYQCINSSVPLVLVTRHAKDLDATLKRYRLGQIFDEVIHLREGEPKSSRLKGAPNAIFIDDSFSERMEVSREIGIRTFDLSMLELLALSSCKSGALPT